MYNGVDSLNRASYDQFDNDHSSMCQFAILTVRQRSVRYRSSSPMICVRQRANSESTSSRTNNSPACQFANDQFANVPVRQRPFGKCQFANDLFTNVSVRQRPFANDHSAKCQFANDDSPTCQFAKDQFVNVFIRQRSFANVSVHQRPFAIVSVRQRLVRQ